MLETFLIGLALLVIAFAIVWAISLKANNYSFLDAAWSYGFAVLAVLYAALGTGYALRRVIFAGIVVTWSLRLGTHILMRVLRHHPQEDPRYRTLRLAWNSPFKFLLFFQLQAIIVLLLSLPFLLSSFHPATALAPLELAGFGLALVALAGEARADWEMKTFAADPAHAGQVCQSGLWRYSRHPNYFFEALIWWGFFLAALGSPWGWTTLYCPLLILWFLLRVTGIPLTEKHSLEKRGEAYRRYQRTTSPFIPWFPKVRP
jgi:steroid 5-alpha reductase family enzyme